MLRWLKRWMAYLLLPAGLVLLFIPLCTHRLGEAERNFLFLENSTDLLAVEKPTHAESPLAESDSLEERVKQMNERRQQKALEDARVAEVVNSYGYPRIRPEDLAPYPALSDAVGTLQRIWASIPSRLNRQDAVPIKEWYAFREAAGLSEEDQAFQYGRYIFRGHVKRESVMVPIEVKNLRIGCKVTGVLFLILGLAVLCGSYAPSSDGGIRVGKRSAILIWDVIIIIVGIPFALWFLDMVFAQVFHTVPEWKENITWGMGLFMVVLANPVLALITTAMSYQTLWITRDTIALRGLFASSTVMWAEVEGMAVSQAFSPRQTGGVWAPKRVMKILEINGGGSTLRVMEPPYASTKKLILETLAEQAPEQWQERIATVSKEWLSKW
ncbi:MAG: hypothetical protein V2A34_09810 [Lentisphaerota bacterium]